MFVIIPTLNEEKGLPRVLDAAKNLGLNVAALDGGSTDATVQIAEQRGIRTIHAPKGKGRALRFFIKNIHLYAPNAKYIILIDGDGTYNLANIVTLQQQLPKDMVIGTRRYLGPSVSLLRRFGNWLLKIGFLILYQRKIPDLLSGFRIISVEKLQKTSLEYNEFEFETELTIKFLKNRWETVWVPVEYYRRFGNSKLRPFRDGWKILKTMIQLRLR